MMHPSERALHRYVDGTLPPRKARRIGAHLLACPACRERSEESKAFLAQLGEVPPFVGRDEVWDRIVRSSADSMAVLLPVADPVRRTIRPRRAFVVGSVAMAALLLTLLALPPATASAPSSLRFVPGEPRPGEAVRVEYASGGGFGHASRLVLRAQLYSAISGVQNTPSWITEFTLIRDREGIYTGTAVLPDSAMFGWFAVEDAEATRVDANGGRGWELLTYHRAGQPTLDALDAQRTHWTDLNWRSALDAARAAADRYPGEPRVWAFLEGLEKQITLRGTATDELRRIFDARFQRLNEALDPAEATADQAAWMWVAHRGGRSDSLAVVWRDRLLEVAPAAHWLSAQARVSDVMSVYYPDPPRLDSALQGLWDDVGPVYYQVALQGWEVAKRLDDPDRIVTWARRYLEVRPGDAAFVSGSLLTHPRERVRQEGLALASKIMARPDSTLLRRALTEDRDAYQMRLARSRGRAMAALGGALVAQGQQGQAVEMMEEAAGIIWDLNLFQDLALIHLAAGRTARAVPYAARVAVDPMATGPRADSVADLLAERRADGLLPGELAEAREALRTWLGPAPGRRPVALRDVPLRDRDGLVQLGTLEELTGGGLSVIGFWSPFCGWSLAQLGGFGPLAEWLADRDVAFLPLTGELGDPSAPHALEAAGFTGEAFFDATHAARMEFDNFATPEYYVVDPAGRILFPVANDLATVRRQVSVLTER